MCVMAEKFQERGKGWAVNKVHLPLGSGLNGCVTIGALGLVGLTL